MVRTPMTFALPQPAAPVGAQQLERLFVLGIDPSLSRTGYCVMIDGVVEVEGVLPTTPDQPRPARLIQVREGVLALLRGRTVDPSVRVLVAMESEIWMSSAAQGSEQAAVQGVLQAALWERLRHYGPDPMGRFLSVNVSHGKKYAGAKQKDEILLQVYKKWGREYRDHNIADAFVMAVIGNDFYNYHVTGRLWDSATKPQIEVLDKLAESGLVWENLPVRKGRKKSKLPA